MANHAVILAGGVGSRLWPLSRELYPKQLLSLFGGRSLLQATLERAIAAQIDHVIIVASFEHQLYVQEQIEELALSKEITIEVLLEPSGKNTAPAIALAAMHVNPHDHLWVMPADHVLFEKDLPDKIKQAFALSNQGQIVTFGVPATYPAEDYGYIEQGPKQEQAFHVLSFKEKPNQSLAEAYCQAGNYVWNSGMFVFTAQTILNALSQHAPAIYQHCQRAYQQKTLSQGGFTFPEHVWQQCPNEPIDTCIMEKANTIMSIPLMGQWSDVGSWNAIYHLEQKDASGNVLQGDVAHTQTKNCFIKSTSRMVAAVGVHDLAIVETADAVLVANRQQSGWMKQLVSQIKQSKSQLTEQTHAIKRRWGSMHQISRNELSHIKSIHIKPKMTMQAKPHTYHFKKWLVIQGQAVVGINNVTHTLNVSDAITIPPQDEHSLSNPDDTPLEVIEICV